jgi:ABC-type nitrate/sulfonate/bicarbonate transport system ATPase subunit
MSESICIKNLSLQIESVEIFNQVNLQLNVGSFNTLLGLSGVGKTQLLRRLANLQDSASHKKSIDLLNGQSVSFVFQNSLLLPWLTIFENLKITTQATDLEIEEALQKVQLPQCKNMFPDQLSIGMQQKINLLRAFLKKSSIVLMDEPFSGLDHANRADLHKQLISFWQIHKCTILFVTHDIDESLVLSQNILLFSKKQKTISENITNSWSYPRKVFDSEFQNFYIETYKKIEHFLTEDFK